MPGLQRDMGVSGLMKMEWEKLRKNQKIPLIAAGLLCGIALIFFGSGGISSRQEEEAPAALLENSLRQTEQALEAEIRELLEGMSGVSGLRVMVNLACSSEDVYGDGGPMQHLIRQDNARVAGIGVVCPGISSERALEITNLLSALFGLPSNKIYVTG